MEITDHWHSAQRREDILKQVHQVSSPWGAVSTCLCPSQISSKIKVDIHLQKRAALSLKKNYPLPMPCMTGIFFPYKRVFLWSQGSCMDNSQLWKATHLGFLSCSSSSTPSPKMLGSLRGFFRALSMQLQNKEASWCMNLKTEIQPAAPS